MIGNVFLRRGMLRPRPDIRSCILPLFILDQVQPLNTIEKPHLKVTFTLQEITKCHVAAETSQFNKRVGQHIKE
jgi:hypothetical protein